MPFTGRLNAGVPAGGVIATLCRRHAPSIGLSSGNRQMLLCDNGANRGGKPRNFFHAPARHSSSGQAPST